jgi:hypothetical protein
LQEFFRRFLNVGIRTGAPDRGGCKLAHIHSCLDAINSLEAKEAELKDIEREMRQTEAIARRYNDVKQKVWLTSLQYQCREKTVSNFVIFQDQKSKSK